MSIHSNIYCSETTYRNRLYEAYCRASLDSPYHQLDIILIAAGYPNNTEIQDLNKRAHDHDFDSCTEEFIHERESIVSRYLPPLQRDGLVPAYLSKQIQEVVNFFELWDWWLAFHKQTSLSVSTASIQTEFIRKKIAERDAILAQQSRATVSACQSSYRRRRNCPVPDLQSSRSSSTAAGFADSSNLPILPDGPVSSNIFTSPEVPTDRHAVRHESSDEAEEAGLLQPPQKSCYRR